MATISHPEDKKRLKSLEQAIEQKNVEAAIDILKDGGMSETFKSNMILFKCSEDPGVEGSEDTDDTILHYAAAFLGEKENVIIEEIVKLSPEVLASCKTNDHQGQNPLHILIVRKQNETLRKIKDLISPFYLKSKVGYALRESIFESKVTGKTFKDTIMEGELPYIVAALTLNIETTRIVIEMTGANIKPQNSKGNTVYHCLIEYAHKHPEEIQEVEAMWGYLLAFVPDNPTDDIDKSRQIALGSKSAFRLANKENMRPLQMAAKHGVSKLFNAILDQEKIPNVRDKLFDSYLYDITVIDSVTHLLDQRDQMKKKPEDISTTRKKTQVTPSEKTPANNRSLEAAEKVGKVIKDDVFQYSQSVLEMICNRRIARNNSSVYEIISQPAMKKLIDLKWNTYKTCLFLWGFVHCFIMIFYSIVAIQWSNVAVPFNFTHPVTTSFQNTFVFASSIVLIPLGVVYFFISLLLIISRCLRPITFDTATRDLGYVVLLFLFSFCLIIDRIWYYIDAEHTTLFILISVFSGWWFFIFYFRAVERISFYVAMLKQVIFGDFLRFLVFICLDIVSFTILFQVLFHGVHIIPVNNDEEDTTFSLRVFGSILQQNIRLMLGVADIEILDKAREPALAYIVYSVYVIVTNLILLNSLIAMISETCVHVRRNNVAFSQTQRLSVILFIEEIFYPFWRKGKLLPKIPFDKRPVFRDEKFSYNRYFLKMTDRQLETTDFHETMTSAKNMQSLTINIQQPFYQEHIDDNNKTVRVLRWNDGSPETSM